MDISGPLPVNQHQQLAAQLPLRKPPEVARIEPGAGSQGAGLDPERAADTEQQEKAARLIMEEREARRRDPAEPAGPPPAFAVTLLEKESDLQQLLARLEATRGHDRAKAELSGENGRIGEGEARA